MSIWWAGLGCRDGHNCGNKKRSGIQTHRAELSCADCVRKHQLWKQPGNLAYRGVEEVGFALQLKKEEDLSSLGRRFVGELTYN